MRLGAIHSDAPAAIQPLSTRAALHRMAVPQRADWWKVCPPDGDAIGNIEYGCCVECADLRIIQSRRANAWGDTWTPAKQMALSLYTLRTGFNQLTGIPDRGTDTVVDMTAWVQYGIRLDEQNLDVVRWATVDPTKDDEIALAIAHLGPLAVTLNLPIAAQDMTVWNQAPGQGSDYAPGSWGMHRVAAGAFDGRERTVRTWGNDVIMHPEFWLRYVVAVDASLSREWLDATGLSPDGLDWDALTADLAGLT
jgi:hypothetical protein